MRIVFAIGNPGHRYGETRHNVGFEVANRVARRRGVFFKKVSALAMEAEAFPGRRLVKPLTYVNRTGAAVGRWLVAEDGKLDELMVVVDDVSLPPGWLRLRARGSHGGHNGLRDIEAALGSSDYARLRIGVGPSPSAALLADHVLGRFEDDERRLVEPALEQAATAIEGWFEGRPLDELMRRYNGSAVNESADG